MSKRLNLRIARRRVIRKHLIKFQVSRAAMEQIMRQMTPPAMLIPDPGHEDLWRFRN